MGKKRQSNEVRWQKVLDSKQLEEGIGPLRVYLKSLDLQLGCAVHLISLIERPGLFQFMMNLEAAFFSYGTSANKFLQITMVHWEESLWNVISFPASYLDQATEMLHKWALTAVEGYPMIIENKRVSYFPVEGVERVYHVECYNPKVKGPLLSLVAYPPVGDRPIGYG